MKAKICDVCGCVYPKNILYKGYDQRFKDKALTGIRFIADDRYDDLYVEMCDDCIQDLRIFLDTHAKNEVIK